MQKISLDSKLRKSGFLFSKPKTADEPEWMAGVSEVTPENTLTKESYFTAFVMDALTAEVIIAEDFSSEAPALFWLNEQISRSPFDWEFQEASSGCGSGNCKEGSCAQKCKGKNCENIGSIECRIL